MKVERWTPCLPAGFNEILCRSLVISLIHHILIKLLGIRAKSRKSAAFLIHVATMPRKENLPTQSFQLLKLAAINDVLGLVSSRYGVFGLNKRLYRCLSGYE